ncbi:MAG TPA: DinB family protein [Anaerolineales bacterium]|nr:DinB family protein [Anaerolineales bacterium]
MEDRALFQELEGSTQIIRALLAGITQEEAQIKPNEQSWSILETVCHLYDEEREDFREHLDFILHRQHDEWHVIDPHSWVVERNYNGQNFAEMQDKFFAERERSLEWLKGLSRADWETTYTSQFGSMRAGDMLASWVAHDNLHIRQSVELRRRRIEKFTQPYEIEYAGDW